MPEQKHSDLLNLTTEIVAAHVSNNPVDANDIPGVIQRIYQTLANLDNPATMQGVKLGARPEPAVSVKKSVTPDFIVCLEDGKKLKMLKRHLRSSYDMSPEQYRQRWDLPSDYPMVAPNYAKQRSRLAKEIGLGTAGRGRGRAKVAVKTTAKRGPGRPRKAA